MEIVVPSNRLLTPLGIVSEVYAVSKYYIGSRILCTCVDFWSRITSPAVVLICIVNTRPSYRVFAVKPAVSETQVYIYTAI